MKLSDLKVGDVIVHHPFDKKYRVKEVGELVARLVRVDAENESWFVYRDFHLDTCEKVEA